MIEVTKRASPLKAIRLKCLECSCGQPEEVRFCPIKECALYGYRFGKRPKNPDDIPTYTVMNYNDTEAAVKAKEEFLGKYGKSKKEEEEV